ncbi:MAG: Fe-S cluster assembly protein HesB [Acidobacteria bacterium]|nr:Fe-S cluster assembly protein HesB [Acidobacteriota bacterium]
MTTKLILETHDAFNFRTAVYSHGWCELRPFEFDQENWRLRYVFGGANPFSVVLSELPGGVEIEAPDGVTDAGTAARILREVRHILRLDEDFSGFYRLTKKQKRLEWIARMSAGRLLRSPTVFEDLVKTLATTNCSWALTRIMTTNLVEKLGREAPDGRRAFPTAAAMAGVSADFYRDEIRAGYRAPYFLELAERVASGQLDPEAWLVSDLPTKELKKEMKAVKGVGDYAAENLLKLVGRYDGLALDSWLRGQFYKKHNRETVCDDREIAAFYEKFGPWRGLAIWCDMTEKWH